MSASKQHKAQTAIELAVFGAILIFALGLVVRSATSRGHQQHALLKATRMALTLSYVTGDTLNVASRNNASVLIVEDRLTAESNKYGAVDRVPTLMQGSGTHSANLFMPIDFGDDEDLPVLDVFVNGRHFTFTTSAFKTVRVFDAGGVCWQRVHGVQTPMPCPVVEPNCIADVMAQNCANNAPLCASGDCIDCSATSTEVFTVPNPDLPCAKLFTIVDNHPLISRWCPDDASCVPPPCAVTVAPGCNLTADERFDLDRNDLDGIPGDLVVPPVERARFAWQWYQVNGFDTRPDTTASIGLLAFAPGFGGGPVRVLSMLRGEGIDINNGVNVSLDVDDDLRLEQIMTDGTDDDGNPLGGIRTDADGIIEEIDVLDFQEGDVDFAIGDSDQKPTPGFLNDVTLYTYVHDAGPGGGTYLRIEEGALFAGSQFIRTTSKKDSVDVIERVFVLSNNTGRFCDLASGNPSFWPNPDGPGPNTGGANYNPVERCDACFNAANVTKTCMDTTNLLIFIRSRISNLRGRRWVTDRGTDPYVPFVR